MRTHLVAAKISELSSNKVMSGTLELRTSERRYGKESIRTRILRRQDWDTAFAIWAWPTLVNLSESTAVEPLHFSAWSSLHIGLHALEKDLYWSVENAELFNAVEPETLARLFANMETYLLENCTHSMARQASVVTRKFVRDALVAYNPEGRISRIKTVYKTKLLGRKNPQKIISDGIFIDPSTGEPTPPVSALRHSTAKDLKDKVEDRLKLDLKHIETACINEINSYEKVCKKLALLRETAPPKNAKFIRDNYRHPIKTELSERDLIGLFSLYLQTDLQAVQNKSTPQGFIHPYAQAITSYICQHLEIQPIGRFSNLLRYDTFLPANTAIACALVIQIRTKWNISSVIEMRKSSITRSRSFVQLQSIKTKVFNETPAVVIETTDELAMKAISLVERSLDQSIKRGYSQTTEERFWLTAHFDQKTGISRRRANWGVHLRNFREKHNLQPFTLEDVRAQALTLVALGQDGAFAAMEAAGHRGMGSIAAYLDSTLHQRLNAATNLEFQRRWEASVRYAMDPASADTTVPLIPIGDGSSCIAPEDPPLRDWLNGLSCSARHCHSADGCGNRRIEINHKRMEEAFRSKHFYERNWQRILNRNPAAFEKFHLQSMLFAIGLCETLKTGPYRHIAKFYEDKVTEE